MWNQKVHIPLHFFETEKYLILYIRTLYFFIYIIEIIVVFWDSLETSYILLGKINETIKTFKQQIMWLH